MQVKAADNLRQRETAAVNATIERLKLNNDETCIEARLEWLRQYCQNPSLPFELLRRYAPFIAIELERQGLKARIKTMLGL
jgi:hypothetical protein